MAYRIFVTDVLKSIAKNTAVASGGEYPANRFKSIIDKWDKPAETRTSEEIINGIRDKLRRLNDVGDNGFSG